MMKIPVFNHIKESSYDYTRDYVINTMESDPLTGEVNLSMGPFVQKLSAGPGVSLSPEVGQGDVTISIVSSGEIRGVVTDIALQNAKERVDNLLTFIGFPKTVESEILCKVLLPASLNSAANFDLYFEYRGEASASSATTGGFTLTYYNIAPDGFTSSTGNTVTTTVDFPTGYSAKTRKTKLVASIPGTALSSNGILTFSVERNIADAYTDEIGIIMIHYIVRTT